MFETTVYNECYPFRLEVLYDESKKKLFMNLLNRRERELLCVGYWASRQNRKTRLITAKRVWKEQCRIKELKMQIQNGYYQEILCDYPNWLLKKNRRVVLSDLVSMMFPHNDVYQC